MPYLPVNGVKLNYIRTGKETDVVLVHGLASSMGFWYPGIVLPLRDHYRVTAYDLRGHGHSSVPPTGYTHMNMAADLAALVDRLGLRRFHLVGHSYGGLVAISYALRHPQRLKSLVLADVPLNEINSTPQWPASWPGLMELQNNLGLTINKDELYPELTLLEELARPQVRRQMSKLLPQGARLPYVWGKGEGRTAKRWLTLLNNTTARDDIRLRQVSADDLRRIGVSTMAVYGMKSKWRSSGEILRDHLPRIEVAYIAKAGHAHPWERPEDFFNHLHHFLEKVEHSDLDSSCRRKHERFPLEMGAFLQTAGGIRYPARTLNVSRNGIMLDCPKTTGRVLEVEIEVVNQDGRSLSIPGKIVRESRYEAEEGEGVVLGVKLLRQGEEGEIWKEFLAQCQPFLKD